MNDKRTIKAPTGTELQAKSWLTEAPLRMLMNNLDPEVAERPEDLVVYGGIGKAARNWEAFDKIVETLRELGGRRNLTGSIWQTSRCISHARRCAARTDRELKSGSGLGELGAFS